ncbi:hypothetical protein N9H95_03230 [Gammaproteobacteria bacterium]|nr:hypothetical protein [Gammaproteobacteria bacterium]
MDKCIYCGEKLSFLEYADKFHAICHLEHQKNNKEKETYIEKASDEEELSSSRPSKANSKYSLNAYLADTTITFFHIFFFIFVASLIYSTYKIYDYFGDGLGLDVFIIGLVIIILNYGLFAIFAEIYRHLKEINSKTKLPDKD